MLLCLQPGIFFEQLGGRIRPTKLLLHDAVGRSERSVMTYYDMKQRDLEDHMFTKQYLKRLQ